MAHCQCKSTAKQSRIDEWGIGEDPTFLQVACVTELIM